LFSGPLGEGVILLVLFASSNDSQTI